MKTKKLDLFDEAKATCPRLPDGTMDEEALRNIIASQINIDIAAEQQKEADRIISAYCRAGKTVPNGQLAFPGMGPYPYEPERMIRSDDGRIVENDKAPLDFKAADYRRSKENLKNVQRQHDRKEEEWGNFTTWVIGQTTIGRNPLELTFGTFVHETGSWAAGTTTEGEEPEAA